MEIIIRNDTVEISGYVNAVERDSKPLWDRFGKFIERIRKGAFARAIKENGDIHVMLNHERDLGSTAKGNLELSEDSIGLKARAIIDDKEVIEDAKAGRLVGWSFGFSDIDVEEGEYNGVRQRIVNDLDLREVSILNDKKSPAYEGTLINARAEEKPVFIGDFLEMEINIRDEQEVKFDNSKYFEMLEEIKA